MQKFEKWIKEQIKHYSPILGIELQEIRIEQKHDETYLSIKCTYPYIDPTLYYSEKSFKDWKKGLIKKDRILHELCHILTDQLYCKSIQRFVSKDEIEDARENLTDNMAAIIRRLDK
jgi:hypothetical protein